MKKLIFILFLLPLLTFGQNRFPSIDSAKNYVLRYVKNSAVESFTNLRMQNVTFGTLQLLDSLCGLGVIDTIWKSGDTLKYRIGTQTVTVGVFSSGGGSTPNLQQVTTQGNSTTDSINIVSNAGERVGIFTKGSAGPPNGVYGKILLQSNFAGVKLELGPSDIWFKTSTYPTVLSGGNSYSQYNNITLPDSSGTLPLRVKLNSTTYSAAINGTIDLGTISSTPDSSIFATRFWVNSTFQPIGNYLTTGSSGSLQNLTITGTNGNGHIHLRHQASLPTATGQSTVIYANSNGDFAYKNDGNYHTTFVTSANTTDRSYTFQNKSYTVADNSEVVKYTDTASMLNGRISSITLNTSGAIHTNPITFNRVGGAWSGSMSLASQSPFTVFRRGSGTGTPTFGSIDSTYFASDFYNQVTNAYDPITAARSGQSLVCDFISPSWPQASGAGFYINEGMGLGAQVSGTGASFSKFIDAPYDGVTLSTGTATSGYARLYQAQGAAATTTANPIFLLSTDTLFVEALVRIPTLSDGTETFATWVGSRDLSSGGVTAPNNTVSFLYYTQSPGFGIAGSANWQTGTAAGGVRTYTTTSTAVVANTWTKLQMKAITGRIEFFINGVSVATHTTNIPSGIMISGELYKSAGTTARTMNIDYIVIKRIYNTKK